MLLPSSKMGIKLREKTTFRIQLLIRKEEIFFFFSTSYNLCLAGAPTSNATKHTKGDKKDGEPYEHAVDLANF